MTMASVPFIPTKTNRGIEGKALSALAGRHMVKQSRLEEHSRAHRAHIRNRRTRKGMRALADFADAAYDMAGAVNRFTKALESLNEYP